MRIRCEREPIVGDKFTNFHAGKGTISIIVPAKDMPFSESGMVPDIIITPLSYGKRMYIAHLFELLAAKIGAISGTFIDATPFNDFDVDSLPDLLENLGFSRHGTEKLICGITGEPIESEIFMAPSFWLRLRHMARDKIHARPRGPINPLTHQPPEGRSKEGGLKIGEMEKDAIIAHGMAQLLKEMFMEKSDITILRVCNFCGFFAYKAFDKDYYKCNGCKNTVNISTVCMPYAVKLLFQELAAVNIQPMIITKDYVDVNNTI
jgi:DNA-directed RNA polymerase II subunit RPB2